jgi:ABC-type transport system involved in multi-copper enzyme maturation permease subunit
MRLIRAELLKARRRSATYVVLIVVLVLMILVFLVYGRAQQEAGGITGSGTGIIEFPAVYAVIAQFAFGLGGLLAVAYSAAMVGADWNWGVVRNVIARGESRAGYLLAKAAALAILLFIAMLIIFAVGIAMAYVAGAVSNVPVASPLRGRGLQDLFDNLVLGYPVLLQRAAIGFAVAVLLRSQLAGAVIGIVLYIGEAIVTTILTGLAVASQFGNQGFGQNGFQPIGPEWFQYLPISIGGNLLNAAPGSSVATGAVGGGGFQGLFLRSVPVEVAFAAVAIYLVIAVAIGVVALQRQELV